MTSKDSEFEKRVLSDVLEQMQDPESTLAKQHRMRRTIYGLGAGGLTVAFILSINEMAQPFFATFLAALAGSAIGFALFLDFSQKQWPITKNHIDLDSVRRRLEELESE